MLICFSILSVSTVPSSRSTSLLLTCSSSSVITQSVVNQIYISNIEV